MLLSSECSWIVARAWPRASQAIKKPIGRPCPGRGPARAVRLQRHEEPPGVLCATFSQWASSEFWALENTMKPPGTCHVTFGSKRGPRIPRPIGAGGGGGASPDEAATGGLGAGGATEGVRGSAATVCGSSSVGSRPSCEQSSCETSRAQCDATNSVSLINLYKL